MDKVIKFFEKPTPFMIAEQDFVLRLRRINRLNLPQTVVGLTRGLTDYTPEDAQSDPVPAALTDLAARLSGEVFIMGNGDVFIILPALEHGQVDHLQSSLSGMMEEQAKAAGDKTVTVYILPRDYTVLREKSNAYIELARSSEVMGKAQQAERALQAEDVRGPLTAWSLSQVEKLLETIDIRRYVRTQPVYTRAGGTAWEKSFIDFFVSVTDLKRERFRHLNLEAPERLFLELCCTLDRILLLELAGQIDSWADKKISLNLSAETVLGAAFAQFCHVLPNMRRANVRFEIHRSDLFLNFTTTRNAMEVMRKEGFQVGIDGITPSVLPFINFSRIDADFYKVNVTREKWPEMQDSQVLQSLTALPSEKIIFSHCDHEEALKRGIALGVMSYQGWLIDDLASVVPS